MHPAAAVTDLIEGKAAVEPGHQGTGAEGHGAQVLVGGARDGEVETGPHRGAHGPTEDPAFQRDLLPVAAGRAPPHHNAARDLRQAFAVRLLKEPLALGLHADIGLRRQALREAEHNW